MAMTMIERVARAQERARNPQWDDAAFDIWWEKDPYFCERITSWGYFRGTRKQRCLFEARAAVEAIREPTASVMETVREKHDFQDASIYSRFIEAALNERVPA